MSDLCSVQTYAATLETPPEFCENEAVDGEDVCLGHLALAYEPDDELALDDPYWDAL